jgi:hypothetical protein
MGMIKRVYGRDGYHSTCYLTRVKLTPKTRWGQLYLHIFHRGDFDRDFHDHPYDFWTFPLRTYYERVLDLSTGKDTRKAVEAFRWHFRPAEYTHIQEGSARYQWVEHRDAEADFLTWARRENVFGGPTATFVWRKPIRRVWGFWVLASQIHETRIFHWFPWREYLFS